VADKELEPPAPGNKEIIYNPTLSSTSVGPSSSGKGRKKNNQNNKK
jgi:hypothetical protein